MPTVWAVNDDGHDFKDAMRFGEVVALTAGKVNIFNLDQVSQKMARLIGKHVEKGSYLLLSGAPILNGLAIYMWLTRFGDCQILQWNAIDRAYEDALLSAVELQLLLTTEAQ